jgi:hypothetical protein
MSKKASVITYDSNNFRLHSDENKRIIKKSVDELGAGRSILLDSDNSIIAGNGVMEAWGDKPIRIIETDGTELIAVKRTDLKTTDENRKKLALLDNHASDTSEFNTSVILDNFDTLFLEEIDLNIPDGFFQRQSKKNEEFIEAKIPYPITIVVNQSDYEDWCLIKRKLNEDNDLKAFKKVLNNKL